MGRTCAWCESVLGSAIGRQTTVSHVLCTGCLEDLRTALEAQHLRPVARAQGPLAQTADGPLHVPVTSGRTRRRAA
ncbi:MAG: hypothetical protein R3E88_10910 [Myxococcota bacterium]